MRNSTLVAGLSEASGVRFSWIDVSREIPKKSKQIWKLLKNVTFHLQSSRYHHSQSFPRLRGICGTPRVRGHHLVREGSRTLLSSTRDEKVENKSDRGDSHE